MSNFLKNPKPNKQKTKETPNQRMPRRNFIKVLGGATALTLAVPGLASTTTTDKPAGEVTSLYVKGLVMVDLGDSSLIRLGFPKAPGHKATLSVLPQSGVKQ